MAGHSQFKNIMHRKGAQDKKRAKIFTKIIRELTTAARTGLPDPNANPRLRAAVFAARAANMPKDTVDRAIKRGSGGDDGEAFECATNWNQMQADLSLKLLPISPGSPAFRPPGNLIS